MASYTLGVHVQAVQDGDWIVFLDILANRYNAIDVNAAPCIDGLQISGVHEASSHTNDAALQALVAQGLVCVGETADLTTSAGAAPLQLSEWISFAGAAFWYAARVKRGELMAALERVKMQKVRSWRACKSRRSAELAFARYSAMRIWAPMPYVCLFNSLLLADYLLRRGISCDLVFGVRARPFAAHCWVEADHQILDDGEEDCESFVEIMRV